MMGGFPLSYALFVPFGRIASQHNCNLVIKTKSYRVQTKHQEGEFFISYLLFQYILLVQANCQFQCGWLSFLVRG